MNAHRTRPWTYDRFVEWSFGPGVAFHAERLAYDLEIEAQELAANDGSASRRFRDLARELRDLAEDRRWSQEGNLAATLLSRAEAGFDRTALLHEVIPAVRQLQSMLELHLYQTLIQHFKDQDIQHPEAVEPVSASA